MEEYSWNNGKRKKKLREYNYVNRVFTVLKIILKQKNTDRKTGEM